MPTLADRPIALAKETTRVAPRARPAYARPELARPDARAETGLQTRLEPSRPQAVSRFIDRVDAFADHLMALIFSTGTAQAFE